MTWQPRYDFEINCGFRELSIETRINLQNAYKVINYKELLTDQKQVKSHIDNT